MKYSQLIEESLKKRHSWLITGVAGFIGSHIAEELLKYNQVIGLDNFLTEIKVILNTCSYARIIEISLL